MKFHIGLYHEYSKAQKEEIVKCKLFDSNTVKLIMNPSFTPEQMRTIRESAEYGVDASLLADPKYNILQMKQISMALRLKQYCIKKCPNLTDRNIREYLLNPDIPANDMEKVIDFMLQVEDKEEFKKVVEEFLGIEPKLEEEQIMKEVKFEDPINLKNISFEKDIPVLEERE